jgi:hypothetical protein
MAPDYDHDTNPPAAAHSRGDPLPSPYDHRFRAAARLAASPLARGPGAADRHARVFVRRAFGVCDLGLGSPELGYVSLAELTAVRGRFGLAVEIDEHFRPMKPLSAYAAEARAAGRIVTSPGRRSPRTGWRDRRSVTGSAVSYIGSSNDPKSPSADANIGQREAASECGRSGMSASEPKMSDRDVRPPPCWSHFAGRSADPVNLARLAWRARVPAAGNCKNSQPAWDDCAAALQALADEVIE